jgi:hypothetical protein
MKNRMLTLAIVVGIATATTFGVAGCTADENTTPPAQVAGQAGADASAHGRHDAHEHAHDTAPAPASDGMWATDAALRTAMERIRLEVQARSPDHQVGALAPADADALATAVERDIAFMIEHCQLAPEPDAALHHLIARLMGAADALRADPASSAGLPQIEAVLQDYGATFDHPGWPAGT